MTSHLVNSSNYSFTPTSHKREVVTYMRFDVDQDYDPRYGKASSELFVSIDDIVCDRDLVGPLLWHGRKISLRAVGNNLDGDDRVTGGVEDRFCFGEMVRLATLSVALDYLDDDRHKWPARYHELLYDLDQDNLMDEFEMSLNDLVDVTEPKVSSYLFGRNYSRECDQDSSDLIGEFWCVSNEAIWHCMNCLKHAIHDPMDIFEILYRTEGYLKGRWENDYLSLHLITTEGTPLPEKFQFRG